MIKTKRTYEDIHLLADAAGIAAAARCTPTPMVVQQHTDVLDDNSPVVKQWFVEGGVCGFAWVRIRGNQGFARWAVAKGIAHVSDYGGVIYWIHGFGQSLERKTAYANEYARVLNSVFHISARPESRID